MAFGGKKAAAKGKQSGGDKQYDETNRGVLFTNDKGDNENRPDMTGYVLIDPNDYEPQPDGLVKIRLAGWQKNSDRAGDYLTLAASKFTEKA